MRFAIGLTLAILATACASTSEPKHLWKNPSVSPAELQTHWHMDKAECDAEAYQAVALPDAPQTNQYLPSSRTSRVEMDTIGSDGYRSSSIATITSGSRGNEVWQMLQQGKESGRHRRSFEAAVDLRDRYSRACLMRRGWQRYRAD